MHRCDYFNRTGNGNLMVCSGDAIDDGSEELTISAETSATEYVNSTAAHIGINTSTNVFILVATQGNIQRKVAVITVARSRSCVVIGDALNCTLRSNRRL